MLFPRARVPAPDLPPGRRSALVVATDTYLDPGLSVLRSPAGDGASLARVLGDDSIGGFAVSEVLDRPWHEAAREVARFLRGRDPGEMVLIYLSCHGLLDSRNRLFFAAADTEKDLLAATAMESSWLMDRVEECGAGAVRVRRAANHPMAP